jgi:glycosyltransferase involved in cell wall biosynthesis
LRNDSAGCVEQLRDGVNGYFITDDALQFAGQIERLLNRSTTNEQLAEMGAASLAIAMPFTKNSYVDNILKP